MPTLIVLRHAKAAAGLGILDIERPLADRGRRDAAATGDWLHAEGLAPDLVLCSTAVRTRETLDGLALDAAEVRHESRIYDNDPDDLLALIRELGAGTGAGTVGTVGTLLLVGHNPSMHQLVHDLTGSAPDAFPTAALAVIELQTAWADARPGAGRLVLARTPKG